MRLCKHWVVGEEFFVTLKVSSSMDARVPICDLRSAICSTSSIPKRLLPKFEKSRTGIDDDLILFSLSLSLSVPSLHFLFFFLTFFKTFSILFQKAKERSGLIKMISPLSGFSTSQKNKQRQKTKKAKGPPRGSKGLRTRAGWVREKEREGATRRDVKVDFLRGILRSSKRGA